MNTKKTVKVLLLDDEALIRMSVTARLRQTNFEVVAVATPEEAIEKLKEGQFQVILTDVMIGAVDGFMFRDVVRGMNTELPIIFFTSILNDSDNKFLSRVMEDEYSLYLPKSAPNNLLIRLLTQVTRSYQAESEMHRIQKDLDMTMHLASFVQTSMLPPWANVNENFFYGVSWHPYMQVSGDLYEWFPITENSSLIIIGDISGHGVSAALAMTAVQSYLKHFSNLSDIAARQVHKIASSIDRFIYQHLSGIAYMSGIVIYLNSKERIIRFCNAGHPDILCYDKDGEKIVLNPENKGGLPLGMIENSVYLEDDVAEASVPEGAVFFVTSDGVACVSTDKEGEDCVSEVRLDEILQVSVRSIAESKLRTPAELPNRIYSMLNDYGYTQKHDDLSFVIFGIRQKYADRIIRLVPINRNEIDAAVKDISIKLSACSRISEELIMRIELLLGEFLMNLHDHGFEDITKHKEVALVCICLQDSRIAIRVFHRGRLWSPKSSTASLEDVFDSLNEQYKTHGRGVLIIQSICESMQAESFDGLNTNTFYVKIEQS